MKSQWARMADHPRCCVDKVFLFFFQESSAFVNKIKFEIFCSRRNSRGKGTKRRKFSPFFIFYFEDEPCFAWFFWVCCENFRIQFLWHCNLPALYTLKLGFAMNLIPCKSAWSQTYYYISDNRLQNCIFCTFVLYCYVNLCKYMFCIIFPKISTLGVYYRLFCLFHFSFFFFFKYFVVHLSNSRYFFLFTPNEW